MMGEETKWVLGFLIAAGGVIMSLIGLDRRTMNKISDGDKTLHDKIEKVKEDYVRRDDLSGHMRHLEQTVNTMADEQRRTNVRIDKILEAVIPKP